MVTKGHAVLQLVDALRSCRKVVGSSRWTVSLTKSFWPHYGAWVDSASTDMSTRNILWGIKNG